MKQFSDTYSSTHLWPDIFMTKTVAQRVAEINDHQKAVMAVTADALMAWANCMAGFGPIPSNFGETMVDVGKFLGFSPLPEKLMEFSKTLELK